MSKRKVSVTPDEMSNRWGGGMKGAIPKIQTGIDRVDVNPCEEAAKKKEKMLANLTRAVTDGTWEKGLGKVSKADWQSITKAKVGSNLASGVDAGMPKRKKFDSWLHGRLNELLPSIADMPDMTIEDSVNRSATMIRGMAERPYKKES